MKPSRLFLLAAVAIVALAAAFAWSRMANRPHNVIIFVADGLRSGIVTADTAPALAEVRDQGVDFHNSHSLFPTVTTPNASAIATGHRLGDTGDFANIVYAGGPPLPASYGSLTAGLEDDPTLTDMDRRFEGNYLGETSLLAAARAKGFSTAAIGKLGRRGCRTSQPTRLSRPSSSTTRPAPQRGCPCPGTCWTPSGRRASTPSRRTAA